MSARRDLPRDQSLPCLPVLFDMDAMRARIARAWVAAGEVAPAERVFSCDVERVKYRPGRNCVVAYRLGVETPRIVRRFAGGRAGPRRSLRRISVAMYPAEEAARRHERASQRATSNAPQVSLQRDAGLLFWHFPDDRKLPALPRFVRGSWVREFWLPQLVRLRWGEGWVARAARAELVSYFPEHSATLRVRLRLAEAGSDRTRVWSVYGKLRYDDSPQRIFSAMGDLHAAGSQPCSAVAYARPLSQCPATRVLWQEGIAAPTLDRALAVGASPVRVWQRVAQAIAGLHAAPLDLPVVLSGEVMARELERATEVISRALPGQAAATTALHVALRQRGPTVDMAADALLHGDLHSRNVLVDPGKVYLIDLDRVGRGPALAELASLCAERVLRDCEAGRDVDWDGIASLAVQYGRARDRGVCGEQLGWHLAAALLRERAYRCVTSLKPGRIAVMPALLAAAGAALDGALVAALPGRAA